MICHTGVGLKSKKPHEERRLRRELDTLRLGRLALPVELQHSHLSEHDFAHVQDYSTDGWEPRLFPILDARWLRCL